MAVRDPFYLVRDEIQESVCKAQDTFSRFERLPASSSERDELSRSVLSDCQNIEWELQELQKVIAVAARDPSRFNIDEAEVDSRRVWTERTRQQIVMIKQAIQASVAEREAMQRDTAARRELLRQQLPPGRDASSVRETVRQENEDFVASEDDTQALIMKQQDDQLDEMSRSLARIGGMGMAIHEELGSQDMLIDELSGAMDQTGGRLQLIQKKMTIILGKAGFKGQLLLLLALVVLMLVLIALLVYG